jgi:hypothetical protein
LLKSFSGRSPYKEQKDVRLYIPDYDVYLKFSFPVLEMWEGKVAGVKAVVNDTLTVPLYLIEEMDRERPSPLAITDVTHVSGTVYAAAAMLVLLGLVGLIAKFPRITPVGDEPGPPDEGEKDPT